jgi:tryptophan 7-halogenase
MDPVASVIVLGGGSAGFLAALALKTKLPDIGVTVIRSKDIGIIGVGEGSTVGLTRFLHNFLAVPQEQFYKIARPTWKLGLRFIWGNRPYFNYTFGPGPDANVNGLSRSFGYYCFEDMEYADPISALMTHDRAFERDGKAPKWHQAVAYHIENEFFVNFLEQLALQRGVEILEDKVIEAPQDENGLTGLRLASGRSESADLYLDCSGFASVLLSKTLGEPFVSFKPSLFNDRAVVGGWDRSSEVIKPYTTCEQMDAGWCWQIDHEWRINRGYVYSSDFISDEAAEREFRAKCPLVGDTRIVRFVSGRYRRAWVKNVVAIGNATGFVEPLEATALGVIAVQSHLLAECLRESGCRPGIRSIEQFNRFHADNWDSIRDFLSIHYKFNTALETPYWQACRVETDLAGAEPIVACYQENGPTALWEPTLMLPHNQFKTAGYAALLLGQQVPHRNPYEPSPDERKRWEQHRGRCKEAALRGMGVREALDVLYSPQWRWAAAPPI